MIAKNVKQHLFTGTVMILLAIGFWIQSTRNHIRTLDTCIAVSWKLVESQLNHSSNNKLREHMIYFNAHIQAYNQMLDSHSLRVLKVIFQLSKKEKFILVGGS